MRASLAVLALLFVMAALTVIHHIQKALYENDTDLYQIVCVDMGAFSSVEEPYLSNTTFRFRDTDGGFDYVVPVDRCKVRLPKTIHLGKEKV